MPGQGGQRVSGVGIKEVARVAQVSPGTVSNVLNRPERVAPETRERVRRAIRELGFVRHGSASTLRAGHSRTIGLSLMDIGNPFFTDVAAGERGPAGPQGPRGEQGLTGPQGPIGKTGPQG
ncbi:LacI family DNA-binding transcriptional regulator, partial [Streptosporangium sp. NPDC049644]|uniref:LacI family DNA-binding transcriptional regulator n=1 Tax=Streptosporangium sp. NPDC049644 TaxID=3155507 RepID=UPI003423E785